LNPAATRSNERILGDKDEVTHGSEPEGAPQVKTRQAQGACEDGRVARQFPVHEAKLVGRIAYSALFSAGDSKSRALPSFPKDSQGPLQQTEQMQAQQTQQKQQTQQQMLRAQQTKQMQAQQMQRKHKADQTERMSWRRADGIIIHRV